VAPHTFSAGYDCALAVVDAEALRRYVGRPRPIEERQKMSVDASAELPVVPARLPSVAKRWMAHPRTGRPFRSLDVVDIDLDTDRVTRQRSSASSNPAPEGVTAFVWLHGEPIGAFTTPGDPAVLSPSLPSLARAVLERAIIEHLLRDSLATPHGLRIAGLDGLGAVSHPPIVDDDPRSVMVAVCTRDRPDELRGCLDALRALDAPAPQILVVDNASSDERTRLLVEHYPEVRYVREPRQGLDWARNRALLEADTDIVAFTDDDVLVHHGWVAGIRKAFREEPAAVAVTGLVIPAELTAPAQVLFELVGGFGRGFHRKWFSAAVDAGEVAAQIYPGTGGAGTGANMALLRKPALALGGFDPALDVGTPTGGGGDLEMFFRVIAAGHLLVYEPSAVVRHVHRATMPQLLKQMRGHGTGSYSIFTGAGRRYGDVQKAEFTRFAGRWFYRRHVRGHARAIARPGKRPVSLVHEEMRGAFSAVLQDLYGQARAQAAAESARYPGEPSAPALIHPTGRRGVQRSAERVVTIDLDGNDLLPGAAHVSAPADGARRVRVLVRRNGRPEDVFAIHTGGRGASAARLRWEVVDRFGPALLVPGVGWGGLRPGREPHGEVTLEAALARASTKVSRLDPRVTVGVLMATRARPDHLRRSLEGLQAHASTRQLHVVVVDNSHDPSETRRLADSYPGSIDVLHEPRPGLSRARNAGMPWVTGDVVLFIDDDVVITHDWLENLIAPFADRDVGVVTGNVVPANPENLEAQLFEDYGGLGRGPHRRRFTPEWLASRRQAVPTWHIGATANAAFRRDVLEKLGPWVESLGAGRPAGVGEDTEYFYRVLRAGQSIAYEPTAVVLHYHRDDRASLAAQLHAYSAGHVAYHLEILARYHDLRSLRRVAVGLPRYYARRVLRAKRGDYPSDLLAAEVRGTLGGVSAWLRSRHGEHG